MGLSPIVVMTAIVGRHSRPPRVLGADADVQFVLVSDEAIDSDPWLRVPVSRYWQDHRYTLGYIKTHPQLFNPADAISVWLDADIDEIRIDAAQIREHVRSAPVVALPHATASCVADEGRSVVERGLDSQSRVARQMDRLESAGFKDDQGLSATMLLIRDLADPQVLQLDQRWWTSMLEGSPHDVLGFDAAGWTTGVEIARIECDVSEANDWCDLRVRSSSVWSELVADSPGSWTSWARFSLDGLPDGYPEPPHFEEEWTERDLQIMRSLNGIVERSAEALEGNYCHMHHDLVGALTPPDPRRGWKREYLRRSLVGVSSFLEIGFNAGHSSAIALTANPGLSTVAIDVADHAYTSECAAALSGHFPRRFTFCPGDSRSILVSQDLRARDYGLVHIDGGHGEDVFRHDLDWWLSTSDSGSRLLVDDAYAHSIKSGLDESISASLIWPTNPGLPSSGENQLFVRT